MLDVGPQNDVAKCSENSNIYQSKLLTLMVCLISLSGNKIKFLNIFFHANVFPQNNVGRPATTMYYLPSGEMSDSIYTGQRKLALQFLQTSLWLLHGLCNGEMQNVVHVVYLIKSHC